ncbi:MAG TPA: response regulator [Myxococcales bacterium]
MNQPSEERVQGGSRQWVCSTCNLVLKEEEATEAVLGRVPVRRISQSELAAAKAANERAAAEKARAAATAAAAAAARAAAARAPARAPAPAQPSPDGLDFDEQSAGDFEIEMGGEVKVISGNAPAAEAFASEVEFDEPQQPAAPQPAAAPRTAAPAAAPAASPTSGAALFSRVIVAQDSTALREMARDALVRAGLCQHVRTCADAMEMLQLIAESIAAGVAVDLAIIDLDMPVLSGHQAALALRAFEKGLQAKPTPILFFTAFPCDDRLKKVLERCQPARYLNKGTDSAPDHIAARLVQVLSSLRR